MLALDQACGSFSQSVQSTWPHHSQTFGETRSMIVNGCGQLLLDEGRSRVDNREAMLTLSYTGFFRLVLHGGGHKVPAAFFSETVKATAIKPGTLTN